MKCVLIIINGKNLYGVGIFTRQKYRHKGIGSMLNEENKTYVET
jgi:hypothetical protein